LRQSMILTTSFFSCDSTYNTRKINRILNNLLKIGIFYVKRNLKIELATLYVLYRVSTRKVRIGFEIFGYESSYMGTQLSIVATSLFCPQPSAVIIVSTSLHKNDKLRRKAFEIFDFQKCKN
jgi:hypothetical protein